VSAVQQWLSLLQINKGILANAKMRSLFGINRVYITWLNNLKEPVLSYIFYLINCEGLAKERIIFIDLSHVNSITKRF